MNKTLKIYSYFPLWIIVDHAGNTKFMLVNFKKNYDVRGSAGIQKGKGRNTTTHEW